MNPAYLANDDKKWRDFSRCRASRVDPEMFFDSNDQAKASFPLTTAEKAAIAICQQCPVSGNCLMWALGKNQVGIWGGMPYRTRKLLKRPSYRRSCLRCKEADVISLDDRFQVCKGCGLSWQVDKEK